MANIAKNLEELNSFLNGTVTIQDGKVQIQDETKLSIIRDIANEFGAVSSSIHDLYMAMGRGETRDFTTPAINIRGMTYDVARQIFKVANKHDVGAFIFEIAKSEIGYTFQRPSEYATVVLAAAIKEGYKGPVFIQGDHFQFNAKNYNQDPEKELQSIQALTKEAIEAGFYNIDIDPSTLVDYSKPTVKEQQYHNYINTAKMTKFIREIEPEGILEVKILQWKNLKPLWKDTLKTFLRECLVYQKCQFKQEQNTVKFPKSNCCEIHLATGFQNMMYDLIPDDFREKIYNWIRENLKNEWKEGWTEEQFIYKTRKKGFGPFKYEWWTLEESAKNKILDALYNKFEFLFDKLAVFGTKEYTDKYIKLVKIPYGKQKA